MSNFGTSIKVSLFGESHGEAIGIVISGLAGGIKLDLVNIQSELDKRKPNDNLSTKRRESDEFRIISGFFNGYTTGTPLTIIIENKDQESKDYSKTKDLLRPSHADYTAIYRYNGFHDYRGGGHFSGRLTAPIVALGAICKQILNSKGIFIGSHIKTLKNIKDYNVNYTNISKELIEELNEKDFPVINEDIKVEMKNQIIDARKNSDSVGGTLESFIIGVPCGIGNPFFDSVESILSHLLFSIPGVKGVEFGLGFDITKLNGSKANDEFLYDNFIKTKSNNNGGINGGITNGMPIIIKTAIKPTPSIGKPQQTVNYKTLKNTELRIIGRHDPAIIHRAIHVQNSMLAYGLLETIIRSEGEKWML